MKAPPRPMMDSEAPQWLQKIEAHHPHQVILYIAMMASSLLFGYLILIFSYTQAQTEANSIEVPKAFIISTLAIVFSSFWMSNVVGYFKEEQYPHMMRSLRYTFFLGLIFMAFQIGGWYQLVVLHPADSIGQNANAYLLALSGLHGLHLVSGVGMLIWVYSSLGKAIVDPVSSLIVQTTPYQLIKVKMLVSWWHFLDILWVILFIDMLLVL